MFEVKLSDAGLDEGVVLRAREGDVLEARLIGGGAGAGVRVGIRTGD